MKSSAKSTATSSKKTTSSSPSETSAKVIDFSQIISKAPKAKIKTILIAHPAPEGAKSPYFDLEKKYGVVFKFHPFIEVQGVTTKEFRKQRIVLTDYSGVIFTSRNSIDHFFRMCDELRVKMSQETKFFCTSEAIALYLQKYTQYRKRKVFFSDKGSNKELKNLMLKHKDSTKFLYICPEISAKEDLINHMIENHLDFKEAAMYKTVPNDLKKINFDSFDMMILFSPAHVSSLFESYPKFKQNKMKIGVYGKVTAEAVIEAKLDFHVMAPLPGIISITAALEDYLK